MTAMAAPRKTVSIHDYPEHLNPFHEEDNHNKIRFWTLGRNRSNSISFSGIKDIKNSWAFRSFLKKGKKNQQTTKEKPTTQGNGNNSDSPIIYRRAMQYSSMSRSTVASPERYVYGGSVTPLPRSRFQERLRSPSQFEVNSLSMTPRMARSEVSGSRLSMESTNPFDEDDPVPPVRTRRKKKRAPAPPPPNDAADVSVSSEISDLHVNENIEKKQSPDGDADLEEMNLNIELKIIEDVDVNQNKAVDITRIEPTQGDSYVITDVTSDSGQDEAKQDDLQIQEHMADEATIRLLESQEDNQNPISFPKVDIITYRRNSSVNEDDIRLRRGNLEDFHVLSNKRSKSLTNNLDTNYLTYDINLNENIHIRDTNGNEEPQKLVCKVYQEDSRKQSIDTISSTEREFLEIDKATRELEREISKLNSALIEDDIPSIGNRMSVSEIKRKFDQNDISSPNPIPKPRRSHYGGSSTP